MSGQWIRHVPGPFVPSVRMAYVWWNGLGDGRFRRESSFEFLPPARLRYRVGELLPAQYVAAGKRRASDVLYALLGHGLSLAPGARVLDFGCGTGGTMVWLQEEGWRLSGTDADADCVAWCRTRLRFADFMVHNRRPPLRYDDHTFDIAFAVSEFTQMDERLQFDWLHELRRVTRPGGLLLLSVHGRQARAALDARSQAELERRGFVAVRDQAPRAVFSNHVAAYHSEKYIRRCWPVGMKLVDYRPRGMSPDQDLVILQRM
jgi:SAM-dependent methyltransferase